MKTGEAAKRLGVDPKTIRTWLDQPELIPFLSPGARGIDVTQRVINDDEFDVLATVYVLRYREGTSSWDDIADQLEAGRREELRPLDGITAQTETVSRPYAEQSARAAATLAERDAALARVQEMEALVQRMLHEAAEREASIRAEYEERIEKLYERIGDLRQQIGRLEERANSDK